MITTWTSIEDLGTGKITFCGTLFSMHKYPTKQSIKVLTSCKKNTLQLDYVRNYSAQSRFNYCFHFERFIAQHGRLFYQCILTRNQIVIFLVFSGISRSNA